MPQIKREVVNSSTIKSIGHDAKTKTLEVEFHGRGGARGKIYRYTPVPTDTFADLINAPSVGSYFAKHIKNNPGISYILYEPKP